MLPPTYQPGIDSHEIWFAQGRPCTSMILYQSFKPTNLAMNSAPRHTTMTANAI